MSFIVSVQERLSRCPTLRHAEPARRCTTCRMPVPRSPSRANSASPTAAISAALAAFSGVDRRFRATASPSRRWRQLHAGRRLRPPSGGDGRGPRPPRAAPIPGRRLLLAFQPHRYTRTRDCFEDFVKVLGTADVRAAVRGVRRRRAPIVAADGRSLAHALRVNGKVEPIFVEDDCRTCPATIMGLVQDGDVVITMGAGSISGRACQTDFL